MYHCWLPGSTTYVEAVIPVVREQSIPTPDLVTKELDSGSMVEWKSRGLENRSTKILKLILHLLSDL